MGVWYSPTMPKRSAEVAREAKQQSSGSSTPPQHVYNPDTGEWVDLKTHKIVVDSSGKQTVVPRDTQDTTQRSGYASPVSNVTVESARQINQEIAGKPLPVEVTPEYKEGLKWQTAFQTAFARKIKYDVPRQYEKRAYEARQQAYQETREKAQQAQAKGFHTIIYESPEGYALEITTPKEKREELIRSAMIKVGQEEYESRPFLSSFEMLFRHPLTMVGTAGDVRAGDYDERYYQLSKMRLKQEALVDKYGFVGHGLSAIDSPFIYAPLGALAGYGVGFAGGKVAISAMTGSKIAGGATIAGQAVGSAMSGFVFAKSVEVASGKDIYYSKEKKDLDRKDLGIDFYDKTSYFLNLGATLAGGYVGYKAGYASATKPYFQVQSKRWVKGEREQGLRYEKEGLGGSSTKEFEIIYKPYKGKQFKAKSLAQEGYQLKEIMQVGDKKLFVRDSRVTVETDLLGYNIAKATSKTTKLPTYSYETTGFATAELKWTADAQTLTDYGLLPEGTKGYSGESRIYYGTKDEAGFILQDYKAMDYKGSGVVESEAFGFTVGKKEMSFFTYPKGTTKYTPIADTASKEAIGWQLKDWTIVGKKGHATLTTSVPTFEPQVVTTPTTTFKTFAPQLSGIGITSPPAIAGSVAGATLALAPKLGIDVLSSQATSPRFDFASKTSSFVATTPKVEVSTKLTPATTTTPKFATEVKTTTLTTTTTAPAVAPPVTPPPAPFLFPPALAFWDSEKGYFEKKYSPFEKRKRPYSYTPSLSSAFLGVTAKKRPKKKTYSGFEQRPLIVSKKKKRGLF